MKILIKRLWLNEFASVARHLKYRTSKIAVRNEL